VGEFTPVEGRLKFEPTAWCPRSGVTHRSPRKITEKTEYLRVVGRAMCTMRSSAELGYLGFRRLARLTGISPVATPRRAPLTDRLKPPPHLMYIDLGNDSGA